MFKYTKFQRTKGLTFVEIMIAVAILGILAAVAIPAWRQYIIGAEASSCGLSIIAARPVATQLILAASGSAKGINREALGLEDLDRNGCTAGIVVTKATAAGVLTIRGRSGKSTFDYNRQIIVSRDEQGTWSCELADGSKKVLSSGSCTDVFN